MLGAPTIMLEKGLAGEEVDLAIRRLEAHLGEPADYLMPLEIGGINSLVPIMAAARLGLPLIDADGMGRAFPELQMTTFNAHGVSTTPLALTDDHGTWLLLEAPDAGAAEGHDPHGIRRARLQRGPVQLSHDGPPGEGLHGPRHPLRRPGRRPRHPLRLAVR